MLDLFDVMYINRLSAVLWLQEVSL